MDQISFPYKCKVRPWRDSDEEIEIQWFYAKPGAKTFPEWHRFASGNWAPDREEWPGVGEVLGTRVAHWSDGPGHMEGQNIVGSLEDFQLGALRATPGLELNSMCFPGEVIGADGGLILTGGEITEMATGPGGEVVGTIEDAGWWTEWVPVGDCEGGGWASFPPWGPMVPDGAGVGGGYFNTYPLWPAMLPVGNAVGGGYFNTYPAWPPLAPDGAAVGLGFDWEWWFDLFPDGGAEGESDYPYRGFTPLDGGAVGSGD